MGKLKGSMGEFSLADIVQIIGFGGKTGRLRIENQADSKDGSIFFEEGRIIHATENGNAGEEAAKALLSMESGVFEFLPGEAPDNRTLMINGPELLMRLAQKMDEAFIGSTDGVLEEAAGDEPNIPELKARLKEHLRARLGRKGKRTFSAIDGAEDTVDALLMACERVEKYIALFMDERLSMEIGREMREVIGF